MKIYSQRNVVPTDTRLSSVISQTLRTGDFYPDPYLRSPEPRLWGVRRQRGKRALAKRGPRSGTFFAYASAQTAQTRAMEALVFATLLAAAIGTIILGFIL